MRDGSLGAVIAGLAAGITLILAFAYSTPVASRAVVANYNQTFFAFSLKTDNFVPVTVSSQLCKAATTSRDASANLLSSNQLQLKERVWISVRPSTVDYELNVIRGKCTIENNDTLSSYPEIVAAIQGTDRCIAGQDFCYRGGMLTDSSRLNMYSISISAEKAEEIARHLDLNATGFYGYFDGMNVETFSPSTVVFDNKLYQLYLLTAPADQVGVQAEGKIIPSSRGGTYLTVLPGHVVNATMSFTTHSTYGGPARLDLQGWTPTRDSGLSIEFSPHHLVIPERSQANTTIIVRAAADARPGIYRVDIADIVNNNASNSDWGSTACDLSRGREGCLTVTVGNSSDWLVLNISGGGVEYSGRSAPPWFKTSVETDKNVYRQGEPIKISVHIANDGNSTLTLPISGSDVVINIYNQSVHFPVSFETPITFEIRATGASNSNNTIVLAPHSRTLLVREFVWDQETYDFAYPYKYLTNLKNVPHGKYCILVALDMTNLGGVAIAEKTLTIS